MAPPPARRTRPRLWSLYDLRTMISVPEKPLRWSPPFLPSTYSPVSQAVPFTTMFAASAGSNGISSGGVSAVGGSFGGGGRLSGGVSATGGSVGGSSGGGISPFAGIGTSRRYALFVHAVNWMSRYRTAIPNNRVHQCFGRLDCL